MNTTEIIEAHFKRGRTTWRLLLVVSVAGAIASVSGAPARQDVPLAAASRTAERLAASPLTDVARSDVFRAALRPLDRNEDARIMAAVEKVETRLRELGYSSVAFEFFTFRPDLFNYLSQATEYAAEPPPASFLEWGQDDVDAFARLLSDVDLPAEVDASTKAVRSDIRTLLANPRAAPVHDELRHLDATLTAFHPESVRVQLHGLIADEEVFDGSGDLASLGESMRRLGFAKVRPLVDAGHAHTVSSQLTTESVSALGFDVPIAILVIVFPWLGAALSIELVHALRGARAWMTRLSPEATFTARLFPWLLLGAATTGRTASAWAIRGFATLVHAAPIVLLSLMVTGADGPPWTSLIGCLGLITLAAAQWFAYRHVRHIPATVTSGVTMPEPGDQELASQLRKHAVGVELEWLSLLGVATAINFFFLVFVLVPPELLGERTALDTARLVRAQLDPIWRQRFIDHEPRFTQWRDSAFPTLQQFALWVDPRFPNDHPLKRDVSEFANHEPMHAYVFSVFGVESVVESKGGFRELNADSVKDAVEVLYRDDLAPLAQKATALAQLFERNGLAPAVRAALPDPLRKAPPPTMTTPVPMPYRTFLERGGFATEALIPLPPRSDADAFAKYLVDRGFATVRGFDEYSEAFRQLDEAIGVNSLKVAGVTVDRRRARQVAMIALLALMVFLLIHLHIARTLIDRFATTPGSRATALSVPSSFLGRAHGRGGPVLAIALLAWPVIAALLIRTSHVGGSEETQRLFSAGVALAIVLTALIGWVRARLVAD